MNSGIYVIQNTANKKVYVGSAVDFGKRRNHHLCSLRKGDHHSSPLQRSWRKHGESAFKWWIAEVCPISLLAEREQWWLDMFEPFARRGYNVSRRADGSRLGLKNSLEHTEKIVAANRGKRRSQAVVQQMRTRALGKRHSAEARRRMSIAQRARAPWRMSEKGRANVAASRTPEVRKRISDAQRANNSMAKLSHAEVGQIRDLCRYGLTQASVARDYHVAGCTVSDIMTGRRRGGCRK